MAVLPGGSETTYRDERSQFTLAAQQYIPDCAPPPPDCDLTLTGITVTNETIKDANDGEISAGVSGNTGSTIQWYIDGQLQTGSGTTNTFTGLTSGYHNLRIVEEGCFDQEEVQILPGEFRTGDFFITSPTGMTVSENPIIFNLQTAVNSANPQPSKGYISVDGTITEGNSIKFQLTYPQSYTAYFYPKFYPNRDNYFLCSTLKNENGDGVGSNSDEEIATSIAEVIENDLVLSRLFYIRTDGNLIYLEAIENNPKLDLNEIINNTVSNISITQTQSGIAQYDGALSENYSLYTDILINDTIQYGSSPSIDTFRKVAQLELPFDRQTNNHKFDIAPVLKNFVSTPKIDFNTTGFTTIASMISAYRVSYGEKYPLIENQTTKKSRKKGITDTKYVYNGALKWEDENSIDDYLGGKLHNVKNDFNGDLTSTGTSKIQFLINDYLYDTGNTGTTDIQFNFSGSTRDFSGQTSGWQDSNFYEMSGDIGDGYVYISGKTSGVTFLYSRQWYKDSRSFEFTDEVDIEPLAGVKFLTNSPNPKYVQRESSEFLYLILPKNYPQALKIKGDLFFYDGSSITGETLYNITSGGTNYGGVFLVAAGYNELGLDSYENYSGGTRKIRRLDFGVYQSDDLNGDYLLSESKSYRFEIDEQPSRYGVAFLNKLGTYDIFDFSGEIIDTIESETEIYEVPRAVNNKGASPRGFKSKASYGTKITKVIEANTGWIGEDTFNWLMELISTNNCYNYTTEDQSYLIITSRDYSKSSNDDLYNINIEFQETIYQNNISV